MKNFFQSQMRSMVLLSSFLLGPLKLDIFGNDISTKTMNLCSDQFLFRQAKILTQLSHALIYPALGAVNQKPKVFQFFFLICTFYKGAHSTSSPVRTF